MMAAVVVEEERQSGSVDGYVVVVIVVVVVAVVVEVVVEVICSLVDYTLEAINRFGTNKGSGTNKVSGTNICCSGLLVYVTVYRLYSS